MESKSQHFFYEKEIRVVGTATSEDEFKSSVFGSFCLTIFLLCLQRMKEVTVGDQKVLLVCTQGQFSAVGSQCSHYNAPLVKGKPSSTFSSSTSTDQYVNE